MLLGDGHIELGEENEEIEEEDDSCIGNELFNVISYVTGTLLTNILKAGKLLHLKSSC